MNVLFLSSWFPYPPDNGSRQRAYYLLQGLATKHTITLLAFTDQDQLSPRVDALDSYTRQIITFPRRLYEPGRARALIGLLSPQPRSLVDTFDPRANETISQIAARNSFHAIIACQLSMAVYAQKIRHPAKFLDEVEAGIYADSYFKARGTQRLRNGLTWLKFARFLEHLTANFHGLTVVSAREKELLAQLHIPTAKIHVIPNGVDCVANAAIDAAVEPYTLIYTGALTYSANLDAMEYFVREILPQIRAVEPRTRLRITGRAPQVAQNELSDDNAVSFTGYLDDVRPLVRASAVCIVPLRQGGGTRLKVLEAMALGTPVVSTTKGAEGLNVTNGEHLLLADSPQEFALATLRLFKDPGLCARLTWAARELVSQEYDWRKIQAAFNASLERIVGQTGMVEET